MRIFIGNGKTKEEIKQYKEKLIEILEDMNNTFIKINETVLEISNNINKMNNTIISMNETILKSNDRLGLLIKEKYNEKKDLKRYENAKDIKGKKIKVINNSIQKNYIYNDNKQII